MSVANNEQLSDVSKRDGDESVCINVEGNEEKIETDMKDNEKNVVVIRIESSATEIAGEKNSDSLNSNSSCEKSDQSLTGSEKSSETASSEEDGVSNPAFVEDEDVGVKQKKGHRRQPSCSPNKDIESAMGGSGDGDSISDNPPILTHDTTDCKTDKQYTEYFMPKTEYKSKLGKEDGKTKKGPGLAKIFCWIMTSLLLTGAIIVAVLIATGFIDTNLNRNIKVSRKLRPDNLTEEVPTPHLLEVKEEDAPNVLTNNPEFFSKIKDSRHFDGELRITNVEWNSDFEEPTTSFVGKMLTSEIEQGLNNMLSRDETVNKHGEFTFDTKVLKFLPGSVRVLFSIDVSTFDKFGDDFDAETISEAIIRNMDSESGALLGKFIVPSSSIEIRNTATHQPQLSVSAFLGEDINTLEQQLEQYESEIFSKPSLEPFTELVIQGGDVIETTTTRVETRTETIIESDNTTVLANNESDEKTNFTVEDSARADVEIIATTDAEIILESDDKDQSDVEIESRTDVYDENEISEKIQSDDNVEMETETGLVNIELEYFRASLDDFDEPINEDKNDFVTTDANTLELNTINSIIVNA